MSNRLFAQAQQSFSVGDAAATERYCRKVLESDPEHADAWHLLGIVHLKRGARAEAIRFIGRSVELEPRQPQALTNLGNALRDLRRLDEALASFDRAIALVPDFAEAHLYRGNTLFDLERYREACDSFERARRLKPGDVRILDNLGLAYRMVGEADQAVQLHRQALQLQPQNADVHNHLATALCDQGQFAEGLACFQQALRLRPQFPGAFYQLGVALANQGRFEEAMQCFAQALRLRPDWELPTMGLGTSLSFLGRFDEGYHWYERALRMRPDWAECKYNMGTSLLGRGDYAAGWPLYEWRLDDPKNRHKPKLDRRWDGGPLEGKRLLIRSEQGLGDALQFVRYAALCKARGATVIVACYPPLRSLFENCDYIDEVVVDAPAGGYDLQIEMMSLPYRFGTTLQDVPAAVPYLKTNAEARRKWAPRFAGVAAPRIGLVWAGNPREHDLAASRIDVRRSMKLEQMKPLLEVEGARFYNLQFGAKAAELDECGLRGRLTDYMSEVEDYLDTAAIIENLDLVIAVDTSVVHAAGGLGKPVWVLSRHDACWRWLRNQERNPWYPSARVFGQTTAGDWAGVVERVRQALQATIRRTGANSCLETVTDP
ncbi:MAG: tetratricopeptide repeat protein [Nevskia sp.]|nr:tetratricopeptide repeat protein [Nevskia sp.]